MCAFAQCTLDNSKNLPNSLLNIGILCALSLFMTTKYKQLTFLLALGVVACGGEPTEQELSSVSFSVEAGSSDSSSGQISQGVDWEEWFEYIFEDLFDDICHFADNWHNHGFVYATCEEILDARGIPKTGFKRTIGRTICIRKLQRAIDEAVCAAEEYQRSQEEAQTEVPVDNADDTPENEDTEPETTDEVASQGNCDSDSDHSCEDGE